MYTCLTFLAITSLASSVSFVVLLAVQQFFDYSSTWIYNLMKVIVIFYLFPAICFALFIFTRAIVRNSYLMGNPDFPMIDIYNLIDLNDVYYGGAVVKILFYIWVLGMVTTFFTSIISGHLFVARIRRRTTAVEEKEIINLVNSLTDSLGIKRSVEVLICSDIISPFTTRVWRPVIILPNLEYDRIELQLILRHELIHVKRRDVLYKQLGAVVKIVHWFNPLSYQLVSRMYEQSELACDEMVLRSEEKDVRVTYARLIVKMLELSSNRQNYITISALEDSENKIRERLEKIMRKRTLKRYQKMGLALTSAIVLAICPIISYASTVGVVHAQNSAVRANIVSTSNDQSDVVLVELTDNMQEFTIPAGAKVLASVRGDNRIDIDIPSGSIAWLNEIKLGAGYIDVSLTADSVNDNFKVGYVRKNGSGAYTNSSRGALLQSFKIVADTYHIYIENTSDHDIHISGRVTV